MHTSVIVQNVVNRRFSRDLYLNIHTAHARESRDDLCVSHELTTQHTLRRQSEPLLKSHVQSTNTHYWNQNTYQQSPSPHHGRTYPYQPKSPPTLNGPRRKSAWPWHRRRRPGMAQWDGGARASTDAQEKKTSARLVRAGMRRSGDLVGAPPRREVSAEIMSVGTRGPRTRTA